MSESTEIEKAIYQVLVEIIQQEKRKAVETGDYAEAMFAAVFEGILKQKCA